MRVLAAAAVLELDVWVVLGANQEIMSMKIFEITFFALCTISWGQGYASSITNLASNDSSTSALVQLCQNTSDNDAQNFCFGFGEGVYQSFLANRNPKIKPSICLTNVTETREQILRKFLTWNKENPQFNEELAAKSLVRFFEIHYPCR